MEKLKSIDMFKLMPTRMTEQTLSGSIFTVLVIAVSIYLLFFEMNITFNEVIKSELAFTDLKMQDLQVNIDIDLLRVPCDIADIRFISRKGREHTIERLRIMKDGGLKPLDQEQRTLEDVQDAMKNGEGCKIRGTFYKHFVVNAFYITFGNPQILALMMMQNPGFRFDLSHKINSLYLGDSSRHESLER